MGFIFEIVQNNLSYICCGLKYIQVLWKYDKIGLVAFALSLGPHNLNKIQTETLI